MATDVEVSPIMDCMKTPPASCNTTRKSKGIRDFFTSSSTGSVNNGISERRETQTPVEADSQVCTETTANKVEQNGKKSDTDRENGISENKHKTKKTRTVSDNKPSVSVVNSDQSLSSPSEHAVTKLSTRGKKSLSTIKKAKEKKSVECTIEHDQKEQADVPRQDEKKEMPQEMEYGEFLKTFLQKPDEDSSAVSSKTDENKGQPCVQFSPDNSEVQNCSEERNTPKEPCNKKNKMKDSESTNQEKPKEQHQTKTKPANAFSILMQAKPNKSKERPVDDDGYVERSDTSQGRSTICADVVEDISDEPEILQVETTSTPSLLNFFTKETKNPTKEGNSGASVVVEVDIHCDPTEQKTTPVRKKPKNLKLKRVVKHTKTSPDSDCEIVFLGSETIEIEDDKVNSKLRSKKRSLSKSSSQTEPSKKTADDTKAKCSTAEEAIHLEKKNAFLQDTSTVDQPVKTAQATLHFGQGGKLAMNASVIAKSASKTSACDSENSDGTETQKKQRKKKHQAKEVCSSEVSEQKTTRIKKRKTDKTEANSKSEDDDDGSGNDQPRKKALLLENKNNMEKEGRPTRLRKPVASDETESNTKEESGSDSKDFTSPPKRSEAGSASRSRAQELLMKARQQKQDSRQKNPRSKKSKHQKPVSVAKKNEEEKSEAVEQTSPEQGPRRQSRRLAEQQKAKQAAEELKCITVDSDSGSENVPTPQKKSTRKKESSHASVKSGSSGSSPKKQAGKLAPIFAKKTKEAVENSPKKPQEDPEVVRRRREFLLSGVPSELKKQAACATACVVTSEFAPFPENSHVQQKLPAETGSVDVWSLGSLAKMGTLYKESPASDEIGVSDLKWTSLQWHPVVCEEPSHVDFKLLAPVSDSLEKDVKEQLMKDIQQTHPGFPVSVLYNKFRERLSPAAAKQEDTPDASSTKATKKKRMDPDIVIVDELEDVATAQTDRDSQWPEQLQPKCASEMIGNESCIRRLRYWLEEWKTLIQREARLSARSAASGRDSDFDYSGEDSEEEGSQLCNTMMLVGPHGVGKTAAVYALAQQLSYKVFEVNASSSRQGRHILSQLQEATQSHQVAQKKDGVVLSPPPVTPTSCSQPEQPVEKKTSKKNTGAVPKAFAGFFKTSENAPEAKTTARTASPKADKKRKSKESPKKNTKKAKVSAEGEGSRKRRRGKDDVEIVEETPASKKQCGEKKTKQHGKAEDGEETNLAGCLNLTSTSLILFDEVDLVFGEDSGFLQTVQHFINTTKIPIILTTTDPGFQRCLNARLETLVFRRPALESVSSYLQTVCLARGMRTSVDDVNKLVSHCQGDVRQALLHLQFLALSGGGVLKESQPIHLKSSEPTTSEKKGHKKLALTASAPLVSSADGNDSDEDFVCLKPLRKKSRRIIDDEDSGGTVVAAADSVQSESVGKVEDSGVVISADKLPAVHLHLYESMLGVPCHLQDLLAESVKEEYNCRLVQQLTEQCMKLKASNVDILHTNLLQLLPLPKTTMPDRWQRPSAQTSAAVKRKRIRSDIYDSEGSDDDSKHQTETASLNPVEQVKNDGENVQADASEIVSEESVSHKDSEEPSTETSGEGVNKKNENEGESKPEEKCGECVEAMEVDNSVANGEDKADNSQSLKVPTEQNQETEERTEVPLKASGKDSQSSKSSLRGSKKCTDHGLGSKLLSSFARYYDSLSAIDMGVDRSDHCSSPCVRGRCLTQPGIEDVPSREQESSGDKGEEIATEIEVCSSRKLWQEVSAGLSLLKEESCSDRLPDGCCIPVSSSLSTLVFAKASVELSVPEPYSKVMTEVVDCLPSAISSSAVVLDYLPTLRCISQAERCRQIAKTKRRFHHHFDNIGLCLSQSTVTALTADFLAGQPDA